VAKVSRQRSKKSTSDHWRWVHRFEGEAGALLIGGVEFGDEAIGFGIKCRRLAGDCQRRVAGALAEEGELKEVRLFAARGAEAAGQADEVKQIPTGQEHPSAGGRGVFG
jgi:hypothetical protein